MASADGFEGPNVQDATVEGAGRDALPGTGPLARSGGCQEPSEPAPAFEMVVGCSIYAIG